jgi:hypothetical protein
MLAHLDFLAHKRLRVSIELSLQTPVIDRRIILFFAIVITADLLLFILLLNS